MPSKKRYGRTILGLYTAGAALAATSPALAYVGPGAGLTLVGSLAAVIVAGAVVVAGLVLFPIRMAMKRMRAAKEADEGVEADAG